jgi:hypothetical protein
MYLSSIGTKVKVDSMEMGQKIIFLIILQNYTTVSNCIRFKHQTPWRTAAAMGYGG